MLLLQISLLLNFSQGWKPGYLALGCQFQFWCVETQMSGFSFGLVSPLLQNRFQFRFCLRTASVSGFQFRFKFHPRKLFYFEYELFKCSTSWHFCFYYDEKLQLRRPSEESNSFRSCRLRYNSESGEIKDSKISIHSSSM